MSGKHRCALCNDAPLCHDGKKPCGYSMPQLGGKCDACRSCYVPCPFGGPLAEPKLEARPC